MRSLRAVVIALILAVGGPVDAQTNDPRIELDASDARLAPMWKAAMAFDRGRYGFSPVPATGMVYWEHDAHREYDDMLHLGEASGRTSRSISFRKVSGGYRWIGEQQLFRSRREFDTVDGRLPEAISLTYEIEPVSGAPLNRLVINYFGNTDKRLISKGDKLTLRDIRPALIKWGY